MIGLGKLPDYSGDPIDGWTGDLPLRTEPKPMTRVWLDRIEEDRLAVVDAVWAREPEKAQIRLCRIATAIAELRRLTDGVR